MKRKESAANYELVDTRKCLKERCVDGVLSAVYRFYMKGRKGRKGDGSKPYQYTVFRLMAPFGMLSFKNY